MHLQATQPTPKPLPDDLRQPPPNREQNPASWANSWLVRTDLVRAGTSDERPIVSQRHTGMVLPGPGRFLNVNTNKPVDFARNEQNDPAARFRQVPGSFGDAVRAANELAHAAQLPSPDAVVAIGVLQADDGAYFVSPLGGWNTAVRPGTVSAHYATIRPRPLPSGGTAEWHAEALTPALKAIVDTDTWIDLSTGARAAISA